MRVLFKLGRDPLPCAFSPWHLAQLLWKRLPPASAAPDFPKYGLIRVRSTSGTFFSQEPSAAAHPAIGNRSASAAKNTPLLISPSGTNHGPVESHRKRRSETACWPS